MGTAPMRVEPDRTLESARPARWLDRKRGQGQAGRIGGTSITEIDRQGEVTSPSSCERSLVGDDFDFHIDFKTDRSRRPASARRTTRSVGKFDLTAEDAALITDLGTKLRGSLGGLERIPNIVATFEGADFRTLPGVHRRSSRAPRGDDERRSCGKNRRALALRHDGLILRRPIGNDCREGDLRGEGHRSAEPDGPFRSSRARSSSAAAGPYAAGGASKGEGHHGYRRQARERQATAHALRSALQYHSPMRAAAPLIRIPAPPHQKTQGSASNVRDTSRSRLCPARAYVSHGERATAIAPTSDRAAAVPNRLAGGAPSGSMLHSCGIPAARCGRASACLTDARRRLGPRRPPCTTRMAGSDDGFRRFEGSGEIEMSTDALFDVPESAKHLVTNRNAAQRRSSPALKIADVVEERPRRGRVPRVRESLRRTPLASTSPKISVGH